MDSRRLVFHRDGKISWRLKATDQWKHNSDYDHVPQELLGGLSDRRKSLLKRAKQITDYDRRQVKMPWG